MIRRPPRSTRVRSSAASDVYKRQVLGEQSQTEDVTTQIVDLSARITNLEATEAALQAIMLKATKIADVLAVQQQLTDTRGQIEQATADRKHDPPSPARSGRACR